VELKLPRRCCHTHGHAGLNRTKVELKSIICCIAGSIVAGFESHQSGIEIQHFDLLRGEFRGLNRTKVELKSGNCARAGDRALRLNRTKVELK